MKKLLSLLVLTASAFTACGGGTGQVAATVDGVEITVGEVEDLVDTGDDSTISKEQFAQLLGTDILWLIVARAAESEFGIVISDADIEAEADTIVEENAEPGVTREDFLAANGVTESFLKSFAHQQLLDLALREALTAGLAAPTQEEIDEVIGQASDLVCASHILVGTAEEAEDVLSRLEDGEEFADLAGQLSLDAGSGAVGGDLGCTNPESYVEEFVEALSTAEIGVPTEPVETQFGFHVILLRDDEIPTEDEVIEQLESEAIGVALNDWFLEQFAAADVEVNERFGTWETDPQPQVVPPTE